MDRIAKLLPLLNNRAFMLLWLGQAVSLLGDAFRRMAILLWVYDISGQSGIAIAAIMLVEVGPILFLSPMAGVVVDRWDKRKTMIWTDIARGILSLALVLAIITGQIGVLYTLLVLAACAAAFFDPARHALLPSLVSKDELQQANGVTVTTRQVALVVGPALGALIYYRLGPQIVFTLDSISFLVSAIALLLIPAPMPSAKQLPTQPSPKAVWLDLLAGLKYIKHTTVILITLIVTAGLFFVAGTNNTVMVFFISKTLGRDPAEVAWLSAANGIAQIIAAAFLTLLARKARPERVLAASTAAMAVGSVMITSSWALPPLIVGVIISSLGNSPFNIARSTIEQVYVEPEYLGRVRGALNMVTMTIFVTASGLAGYLVDVLNPRMVLTISASVMIIAALATRVFLVRLIEAADRNRAVQPIFE